MKLGEFFISLIVDASSGEVTVGNLVTKMGELEAATLGELGALFALSTKLAGMTDQSIKAAVGLEKYKTLTGDASGELEKWSGVAVQAHSSGELVQKTFMHISSSLQNMRANQPNALRPVVDYIRNFGDLSKFDPSKPAEFLKALRENADFMSKTPSQKKMLMDMIGIDPEILLILNLTNKEFERLEENSSRMSEKGQKDFLSIATSLATIGQVAHQIGIEITEWDAPLLKASLDFIINKLEGIKAWYKGFKVTSDAEVDAFETFRDAASTDKSRNKWGDIFSYMFGAQGGPGSRNPAGNMPLSYVSAVAANSRDLVAHDFPAPTAAPVSIHNETTVMIDGKHIPSTATHAAKRVAHDITKDAAHFINQGPH